ncbi:MAG: Fic family protein [Acidimicrobiia bacterium]
MRFPTLDEVIACNELVREPDEASPSADDDDLDLVASALERARAIKESVDAAATLLFEITSAQGFFEGNKRTAVLIARWFLTINTDRDPDDLIRPDDRELGALLVRAARGEDVEHEVIELLRHRA